MRYGNEGNEERRMTSGAKGVHVQSGAKRILISDDVLDHLGELQRTMQPRLDMRYLVEAALEVAASTPGGLQAVAPNSACVGRWMSTRDRKVRPRQHTKPSFTTLEFSSMSTITIRHKFASLRQATEARMSMATNIAPKAMAAGLVIVGVADMAIAAGTLGATSQGQALKSAYDAMNDLSGGYGKALAMVIAFLITFFAMLASQATGPVLKFMGLAVFGSMGLGAALTLSGAYI